MANKVILEVENLTKYFNTPGGLLHAVDGVNFKVEEGRTLGIFSGRIRLRKIHHRAHHLKAFGTHVRKDHF